MVVDLPPLRVGGACCAGGGGGGGGPPPPSLRRKGGGGGGGGPPPLQEGEGGGGGWWCGTDLKKSSATSAGTIIHLGSSTTFFPTGALQALEDLFGVPETNLEKDLLTPSVSKSFVPKTRLSFAHTQFVLTT